MVRQARIFAETREGFVPRLGRIVVRQGGTRGEGICSHGIRAAAAGDVRD